MTTQYSHNVIARTVDFWHISPSAGKMVLHVECTFHLGEGGGSRDALIHIAGRARHPEEPVDDVVPPTGSLTRQQPVVSVDDEVRVPVHSHSGAPRMQQELHGTRVGQRVKT